MSGDATATTWHTVITTTLGDLTLVRDREALLGLYFPGHWTRPDRATFGPRSDQGFDDVTRQLGEYLDGRRREFDLPLRLHGDAFQLRVWDLIREVGYGETATYGDLANRLRDENGGDLGGGVMAQRVGAAVGHNPLSVLVPCHRIVGRGGKLTGYAGGLARKRQLLELEQDELALIPAAHLADTAG